MQRFIAVMFLIVGAVHLLPLSGVLGAERLAALYGIDVAEPNLAILMRHRAVLFGLLGGFLIYAAFRPAVRVLAWVAGTVSVGSFVVIAWTVPGYNEQVARVVLADVVALVCLALAAAASAYERTSRGAAR